MTKGAQTPENTSSGHIGDQFRQGREAAGWSRGDLSDVCGISVAKIARVELKGTGTDEEIKAIRDALKIALGEVLVGGDPEPAEPAPTQSPAITGFIGDAVRVTEWNGLSRGDIVKIKGEDGNFRFLFYHQDDHQQYVEVSGPLVRYRDAVRGTRLRSIRPERIIRTGRTRR